MKLSTKLAGCLALGVSAASMQSFAAPQCEIDRPVNFGGMAWESNMLMVEVERFILKHGYGCKSQVQPGGSLSILAGMQRGDVDVISETWKNSIADAWKKAEESGKVSSIGTAFVGQESWYIPAYTAAKYPELKSVTDLAKYSDKFADPEEPGKGRFYGCPAGWGCDVSSHNIFKALNMGETYSYYSPGTAAAQRAAITSAVKRKRDIVFYYWVPTPMVGEMDLVRLEMPEYNEANYLCITDADCVDPKASDYPQTEVLTSVNNEFKAQAPKIVEFLSKVSVKPDDLNAVMAWANENGAESDEAALHYLKQHPEAWSKWLPEDAAASVKAAL